MNSILDDLDAGQPEAPTKTKVWSPFQQAIFDAVKDPAADLLIQAVAGSGKTTTIIEAMDYSPGSSLFMAFNKAIADDIRTKARSGDVKTLNALGHKLMMENRGGDLDFKKKSKIIKGIMGDSQDEKDFGYTLARVVGLAQNCAFGLEHAPTGQEFVNLIEAYAFEIPFDKLNDFGVICREAFELNRLDHKTFDFDDQLWIPISEGWDFPSYSNCFVDECQDLSPIQHEMLIQLKRSGARLVGVGDRHQAIYGFRGASHDSMDQMKKLFDMKELPLSISYRCSQFIVQAAQEFCPTIQWREGAPEGNVDWAESDPELFERHMILCRTNAPLFRAILAHVRARKPCQVMSNFLDSYQGFIRSFKARYTSDLLAKLDRWYEREREAARKAGKRGKIIALMDKYDTTKVLCSEFTQVEDMLQMVRRLGESRSGPIFATIHKAKGLEHQNIYVLRPDQLGGFGDLTPEQQQQEDNLHYVAITRAKETLTYGARLPR
jgi:DNA helicase-2/ATP-dependent DNA helicase PcrA